MTQAYHLAEWTNRNDGSYVPAFVLPLEIKDSSVFLDLGCGSGYINAYVSSHFAPSKNVGIDHDHRTIQLAYRLNAGNGAVNWMCASAESIPLADASVDYIVCRAVVPYVRIDPVFGEIGRILRPGGKVVFLLHSWTFYLKWLSVRNLKRNVFAVVHFLIGTWFNLTGYQIQLRWRHHVIGQTWQTADRVRKTLGQRGLTPYKVVSTPEFLVYAQKTARAETVMLTASPDRESPANTETSTAQTLRTADIRSGLVNLN